MRSLTVRLSLALALSACTLIVAGQSVPSSLSYPAGPGGGGGKHVVFIAGDEEYRSEESLPMLAKILSQRHGFRTTVLFSVDPDGTINPKNGASLSNPQAIDSADLIVMAVRFRAWPDEAMRRFDAKLKAGVPILALRTSTHAFNGFQAMSPWASWNYNANGGWGRRVLGETWVNHWGKHKVEATRGVIEPSAASHPVLRGVQDLFGDTDVYEAYPSADATILVRGIVLQTLQPNAPPAVYQKARSTDKQMQDVNTPAMPIVWTRTYTQETGKTNRVLVSTIGSATDLTNEGLRRMAVNGVYWGLGLNVPDRADVRLVDPYTPSAYGFDGFRQGLHVSDFALGR